MQDICASVCVCTDVICVDAIIKSIEAFMDLSDASRALSTRLRLRVGKLDISYLGVLPASLLLYVLDPEVLT